VGPHTFTRPVKFPTHDSLATEAQAAVTKTLSGEDPQLGNEDGLTVNETVSGWLEVAFKVTGETV